MKAKRKITYLIPVRTVSEANTRCHWAVRAKRAKEHKHMAAVYTGLTARKGTPTYLPGPKSQFIIRLTRIGRKMDSDNLAGSMKAVRDGIAYWLDIDDGDDRITWRYDQVKPGKDKLGVIVTLQELG